MALSLVATKEKQSNHFNGDLKKCKVHNVEIYIYIMISVKFEKLVEAIEGMAKGQQGPPNAADYLNLDTRPFGGTAARRLVARASFTDIVYERVDSMYRSMTSIFRIGTYSIFEM